MFGRVNNNIPRGNEDQENRVDSWSFPSTYGQSKYRSRLGRRKPLTVPSLNETDERTPDSLVPSDQASTPNQTRVDTDFLKTPGKNLKEIQTILSPFDPLRNLDSDSDLANDEGDSGGTVVQRRTEKASSQWASPALGKPVYLTSGWANQSDQPRNGLKSTHSTVKSDANKVSVNHEMDSDGTVIRRRPNTGKSEFKIDFDSSETWPLHQSEPIMPKFPSLPETKLCSQPMNEFKSCTLNSNLSSSASKSTMLMPPPPCPPRANLFNVITPQQANLIHVNGVPYMLLSLLGQGGSSKVYQVLSSTSSKLLAVKCVDLKDVDETVAQGYLNEIDTLSKLQHCTSVIKLHDHEYVPILGKLYVVLEKGETDFSNLIKRMTETKQVSVPMIVYYWTEMLRAVKDIHDQDVVHSDLKPQNFLLVEGRLKLIDFGIACSLQQDVTSVIKDGAFGTYNYISPEVVVHYKISKTNDIWSLGCILYNLVYGRPPFGHLVPTLRKMQAIADPNFKIPFPEPERPVPMVIRLALKWCLVREPKSRPTVDELIGLSELSESRDKSLMNQINRLTSSYYRQVFPKLALIDE